MADMKDNGYTDKPELRLTREAIGKTVTAMMIKHNLDTDKCRQVRWNWHGRVFSDDITGPWSCD